MNPRLHAALNGDRDHPRTPRTPHELAADALEAARLGAATVHVHPYGDDGRPATGNAELVTAAAALLARTGP